MLGATLAVAPVSIPLADEVKPASADVQYQCVNRQVQNPGTGVWRGPTILPGTGVWVPPRWVLPRWVSGYWFYTDTGEGPDYSPPPPRWIPGYLVPGSWTPARWIPPFVVAPPHYVPATYSTVQDCTVPKTHSHDTDFEVVAEATGCTLLGFVNLGLGGLCAVVLAPTDQACKVITTPPRQHC